MHRKDMDGRDKKSRCDKKRIAEIGGLGEDKRGIAER